MEKKVSRRGFLSAASVLSVSAAAGVSFAAEKNAKSLEGQVALITGATSGIGEATAYVMARRGAKVMFCGRREELGRKVEKKIRTDGGEATYFRADVREESQVKALVDECKKKYGALHIAFNNAGIAPAPKDLQDLTHEEIMNAMLTNYFGVFYAMKYEIPLILASGGGAITNCGSYSSDHGHEGFVPYTSSKHAMSGLTKVAALELAQKGVLVNSVNPYAVDTPMLRNRAKFLGVKMERLSSRRPTRKLSAPEDVAEFVAFLSSPENRIIHGQEIDLSMGKNIDM